MSEAEFSPKDQHAAHLRKVWPYREAALAALHPSRSYSQSREMVAPIVHAVLQNVRPENPLSTTEVAGKIIGLLLDKKAHPAEFNRIFRVLQDLAKGQLRDCVTAGEAKPFRGKIARPKLWHTGPLHPVEGPKNTPAPSTNHTICQHCGSILPKV